jgi:Bacterial Ig domain/Multicopper oxidase
MKTKIKRSLLAGVVALACGNALGAEYWLCAGTFNKTMPDGSVVQMWGYADVSTVVGNVCPASGNAAYTAPGPQLNVPDTEASLTIHLQNTLAEPTSLVIPGQTETAMAPVIVGNRVQSFTHEVAPAASGDYIWNNLKPGSYAYQTGTHPAKQVQMGLYGAMVKDNAVGTAYPGISYDTQVIEFLSEIDPVMHSRVANGSFGTPCATPAEQKANPCTSTIGYNPKWFLVNGEVFVDPTPAAPTTIPGGNLGATTLIRFFNMGLRSHAMVFQGATMKVVAEDGRVLPVPHDQYSLMVAAGKTHDALFTPSAPGVYPLYERMHNVSTAADSMGTIKAGGLMSFLEIANLTAVNDAFSGNEDAVIGGNVLTNDTAPSGSTVAVITAPTSGTVSSIASDGSFTYTPVANFNGQDSFTYQINDGATPTNNLSNIATVNLTVAPVNDAPTLAPISTQQVLSGVAFNLGVVGSDIDAGDTLTYSLVGEPSGMAITTSATGGTISWATAAPVGTYSVTVTVTDSSGAANNSASQTFTLTVTAVPVTPVVYFSTFGNTNPTGLAGTADDADIYSWNGTAFARVVDATTKGVPTAANLDEFKIVDATHFYASFATNTTLPGIGTVQDEDIVYYNGSTWSVFFNGTNKGLTNPNHDIDAFDIAGNMVYFSMSGSTNAPGATNPPGTGGTADNADIYSWNGTSFQRVVDLSTKGVPNAPNSGSAANVDGLKFVDSTHFYVSFAGNVTLPGIGIVQDEDIVYYNGSTSTWSVFFDGTAAPKSLTNGNQDIDGFDIKPLP